MSKYDYVIAIDPDVEESGVAHLNVATREFLLSKRRFPELVNYCVTAYNTAKEAGKKVAVVIEAGWKNRPNWHIQGRGARVAAAIGKQTGRNHEVGRLLVECLEYNNIPVDTPMPLKKCWCGHDGKITAGELSSFTGIKGRTNQDVRDAALLAWVYADLPIKIPPKGRFC